LEIDLNKFEMMSAVLIWKVLRIKELFWVIGIINLNFDQIFFGFKEYQSD